MIFTLSSEVGFEGVLQQGGACHWTYTPGYVSDVRALVFHVLKIDITQQVDNGIRMLQNNPASPTEDAGNQTQ